MKKSELKTGMIVETSFGYTSMVMLDTPSGDMLAGLRGTWSDLDMYDTVLRHGTASIDKVWAAPMSSQVAETFKAGKATTELLWEREPELEIPKFYRLLKVGETVGPRDKVWRHGRGPWVNVAGDSYVGDPVGEHDAAHCTPDIEVPEGYELWHVAGEEAKVLPAGHLYKNTGSGDWYPGGLKTLPSDTAKLYHYAIPVNKPQEETMVTVNGKEFSESTVAAALREYVK